MLPCLLGLALLALLALPAAQVRAAEPQVIRVAAFESQPLIFRDADGKATGAFPDMLAAVAKEKGYKLEYVWGTWAECLQRMKSGEADVITCAARTEERQAFMDYCQTPTLTVWAEVYVPADSDVDSILKLKGRRIAVMRDDFNGAALQNMATSFGLDCSYVVVDNLDEVLSRVEKGDVDAGVVGSAYGASQATSYAVRSSGIVFNPFSLYFAVGKGRHGKFLAALDESLAAWKSSPDSIYYTSIHKWTHQDLRVERVVPLMMKQVLVVLAAGLLLSIVFVVALRLQVRRTMAEVRAGEAQLRESEGRFRQIAETVHEVFWVGSPDFSKIDYVSPEFERIWGIPVEEVYRNGLRWLEAVVEEDVPAVQAMIEKQQAGLTGELRYPDTRIRRPDGEIRWVSSQAYPVPQEPGKEPRVVGVVEDVTSRTRAQEEQRQLAVALDFVAEGIVITGSDGAIQYVNPAIEKISGYTREELIGKNPRIFKSPEQDGAVHTEMWTAITAGQTWSGRLVNRRKDGSTRTVDITISPILGKNGAIERFVAVQRDMTEEMRLESALRNAQRMEAIGRLAAGVAHDFNNLLTPIIGYAELIHQNASPSDFKLEERVENIVDAAARAQELTSQLLAFGRRQTLRIKLVDLNDVLSDLQKLLSRTVREHVRVAIETAPYPCGVLADTGQMGQILMNLAVNAQDAMPDGGEFRVRLDQCELDAREASGFEGLSPGRFVRLIASDTGAGMDEDTRAHAFDPFYSTKGEGGTGLGLATVYGIVKQHGGHVLLDSQPDQGTTFTILFPAAELPGVKVDPEPETVAESIGGNECILLAEDDDAIRLLAETLLTDAGYRVIPTGGGKEAIRQVDEHAAEIDLLLSDVIMPEVNGPGLYEYLLKRKPGVGVVFISGYPQDVIKPQVLLSPEAPMVQKPFRHHALLSAVRSVLDRRRAEGA